MSELARGLRGRFCRRHYLQICLALLDESAQSTRPETETTVSTETKTETTPPMPRQRPHTARCAPAPALECEWTSPWVEAAQNADWCVPEVRP